MEAAGGGGGDRCALPGPSPITSAGSAPQRALYEPLGRPKCSGEEERIVFQESFNEALQPRWHKRNTGAQLNPLFENVQTRLFLQTHSGLIPPLCPLHAAVAFTGSGLTFPSDGIF